MATLSNRGAGGAGRRPEAEAGEPGGGWMRIRGAQVVETIQFYQREWRNLCREASKRKFRDEKGKWYPNPAVGQRDRVAQELHRWLSSYVQWGLADADPADGPVVVDAATELKKVRAARRKK